VRLFVVGALAPLRPISTPTAMGSAKYSAFNKRSKAALKTLLPTEGCKMITFDPTSATISGVGAAEQEWSVEDVARLQAAEPTGAAAAAEEAARAPAPIPPLPLPKRAVSGRYRSTGAGFQLELRVDVDGRRPMNRVSGDFYQVAGATVTYFGSFIVNTPTITVTDTTVTIEGLGTYTWSASAPKLRVTIPRTTIVQPPAAATAQFFTVNNAPGATYICPFQSVYFRTIQYEEDREQGVTAFVSYNTGALPSGGPARTLTVAAAYAEAGIEFQISPAVDVVPTAEAGVNLSWNDSELHASMVRHFSLWKDEPQWKVWLLAAYQHDLGPGLYGIMFDQLGKQRQGCATFHRGIGGATADRLRLQLYTYVHELGHCFNLLHSWQKSFAVPPAPNRPAALSWMNYPWYYPGGDSAFWSAFPFQFDDLEVIHLRHAFRNNLIMGGNNFTIGSALTALQDPQAFADPIEDNSGLQLELEAPKPSFAYGEPVVLEIKLRLTDMRGKRVHAYLHPNMGFVQVGIRKPNGQVMLYRPPIEHCVFPDANIATLDANRPAIYDSAYLGYGKDGFYFDQAGLYRIRAVYYALDGSQVVSNILTVRVRAPLNATDEEIADLFLGDEQGMLLYLLGSDSESLERGNEAFDLVLDKHSTHPMAVYARLVKGINAGRAFKTVTPDKKVVVRKAQSDQSVKLLSAVVDASEAGMGVDNITLNMAMRSLAGVQKSAGDEISAKATMERMVGIFRKKALKPHVLRVIEIQAATI
jgi:hypothetical protein